MTEKGLLVKSSVERYKSTIAMRKMKIGNRS